MPKQPETIFGERVDDDLKKIFGNTAWSENIQQVGINGTPDRLCCINGRFVALELKVATGSPSMSQRIKLAEIRKAGGLSYVVYPYTWDKILSEIIEICVPV